MGQISATELARNTRDILDRVMQQGETVAIVRNNVVIAQIAPSKRSLTATQALKNLKPPLLSFQQGAAWLKASKQDFDESVRDPWA